MGACTVCHAENAADANFCSRCGNQLPRPSSVQHVRKTVTILFTDVVDSTELTGRRDAESINRVLRRFFENTRQVIEREGGVVQRYVGDGVIAAFGLPQVHSDDPLRAVKAALAIHATLRTLNQELVRDWSVELELHTAVSTGEVVVEGGDTRLDVAAEHINLVSDLTKAARPGEILIAPATYALVRGSVRAERVSAQTRGGDGRAYRVLELSERPGGVHRVLLPLIGRDQELASLHNAYGWALRRRRPYLASLLGDAGVGKTRLVDEFVRELSRRPDVLNRPLVLRGVCQRPSAEMTYYPMRQMLRQAAGIKADTSPGTARQRLASLVGDDQRVVARLAPFIGLGGSAAEPQETIRAICRALMMLALQQPLVLVVDDLHWAEQPMLEILEEAKESLTDSPVLLIAVSRPDFLDDARDWAGWVRNTTSIPVDPLGRADTEQMIEHLLLGGEVDSKIVSAIAEKTGGSPLDVEVMMADLLEEQVLRLEEGHWTLQGDLGRLARGYTVNAAFTSRIERLKDPERTVAVRAAVIGDQFRTTELAVLVPDLSWDELSQSLGSLVRKELLKFQPDAAELSESDDERYSFRHNRYWEAAYGLLPKEDRATLHEQYASWLAERDDRSPSMAERVGYHFRYSRGYLAELRSETAEEVASLSQRAGGWYMEAGRRFILQGTFPVPSATRAFRHAIRLLPAGSPEALRAQLDLADTLQEPDPASARETYETVAELAASLGHRATERHAVLGRLELGWYLGSEIDFDQDRRRIEESITEFETYGGDAGTHLTAKAFRLLTNAHAAMGAAKDALAAADRSLELIGRTEDARLQAKIARLRLVTMFWGPTPAEDVVREAEQALAWARHDGLYLLESACLSLLARTAAWRGDFDQARQYNDEAKQADPTGTDLLTAATSVISEANVETVARNFDGAERIVRRALEALERRPSPTLQSTLSAILARVLIFQDSDDEAERYVQQCRDKAMPSQLDAQIKWRHLRGLLLARRGEHEQAEELCRDAVALAERSQQPVSQAEAFNELADVLRMQGRYAEARVAATEAIRRYRQKGHLVATRNSERLLARLVAADR